MKNNKFQSLLEKVIKISKILTILGKSLEPRDKATKVFEEIVLSSKRVKK